MLDYGESDASLALHALSGLVLAAIEPMSRNWRRLVITFVLVLFRPFGIFAHEGKLDPYGCHYEKDGKDYHCHEGVFKGGSFDSKTEMIRQLRRQFLDLGRPWPYSEIVEEDIPRLNLRRRQKCRD